MLETKKNEIRYTTSDPKKLLNKYIAKNVYKKWNETFKDESTGEETTIERNELLLTAGQFIDQDLLMKIQFSIQAQEIKDVEVSNQNRKGFEIENEVMRPYIAQIECNEKKRKFLFYADSINSAYLIVKDFSELTVDSQFEILLLKKFDDAIILTDRIEKSEEEKNQMSFYQIDVNVKYSNDMSISDEFVINTLNIERGMIVITDYLQSLEERAQKNAIEHNIERNKLTFTLEILEAKPLPISSFISREFSSSYVAE